MSQMPEILSPAGSLEKLRTAVLYGADAVYVGGLYFGLRTASENLTDEELRQGVSFAHRHGAKVFVVLNGFLHDEDLEHLPPFCRFLESIAVDAVICSDMGVIATVRNNSELPIHLSTQASCLNSYSGRLWAQTGVSRLILGREVSLVEGQKIKEQTGLEIELFVHGSMCSAYSGNCVISNYTAGRDSNRGGCAHSCRFSYSLRDGERSEQSFFMSSKDLQGIALLEQYVAAGVDSIKIEGRMKGPIYVATVTKVYREALDYLGHWRRDGEGDRAEWCQRLSGWQRELESFAHRDYSTASLLFPAGPDSIYDQREELKKRSHDVLGTVVEVSKKELIVSVKNSFAADSVVEVLPFRGAPIVFPAGQMKSLGGASLECARSSTLVRLSGVLGVERGNVVRQSCRIR